MIRSVYWVAFLFGFLSVEPAYSQTNLLRNTGYETQGSGSIEAYQWEGGNPDQNGARWGSAIRVDWRAMSGNWSAAIRGTWAGQGDNGGFWQQSPATPGQRYRFSAWLWADGEGNKWQQPANQGMAIEFFDASINLIENNVLPLEHIGPNWVRKGLEAVAPANAAWARVVVSAFGVGASGALHFDDLELIAVEESDHILPGPSSRRTGLVISEIMYNPANRTDGKDLEFVELHNTTPFTVSLAGHRLSGSIAYTFDDTTEIPPLGFLVMAKEPASVESEYGISGVLGPYAENLPNNSGRVRLRKAQPLNNQGDAILLEVNYSDLPPWPLAADGGGHSLVLAHASYGEDDPRAWRASAELGGSPGGPEPIVQNALTNVVINEFLAHTDEPEWDFIELYNRSSSSIDLSGCTLSDTVHTNKFTIPNGTVIPANGFVVFSECPTRLDNPPVLCETNFNFGLSSTGEDVVFCAPDGTVIDAIRFGAQENGVSKGRYPDGAPGYHRLSSSTPGAANDALLVSPVVINEIMFNPPSRDDNDQYVELHNWSGTSVDISHWRFVDGISFTFPPGTSIPAGGYLVVAKSALHLMSNYPGVLNSGNTIGDFSGNLSRSGERIALAKPDDLDFPAQDFVVVNEVTYYEGGAWGEWANGGGSSVELIDPRSDNRLAANWANSDESAKSDWVLIQSTNVLEHGMLPGGVNIDELHLVSLRRGQVLVDNVEVRRMVGVNEEGNRVANSTFESGLSGWTVQGNVIQSGLAAEGYSSSQSLHVRATGSGDTGADRIKTGLNSTFSEGQTAVIRARARWVRGDPHILMRLRGNYMEVVEELPIPKNLGTPGQPNSQAQANAGPAISDVTHYPVRPEANEPVTVTARVHDPDGIDFVQLRYRVDPSTTTQTVAMSHVGGGLYSGAIPGQAYDQLVAFHIVAGDNHASPSVSRFPREVEPGTRPGPGQEALIRFGSPDPISGLGTYQFWMTQANIDEWEAREPHSNEYLDTTMVYGNDRVIYNAAIRFRGSPWVRSVMGGPEFYESRSAFRVKIPADQNFLGMDELNLDTLEQYKDATLQREQTVYRIGNELGLPASYQRYIFVVLNGIHFPYAYADVHHIERDYFRTWFPGQDDGELRKVDDWAEYRNFTDNFDNGGFAITDGTLERFTTAGDMLKKARYRWNWERQANAGYSDDFSSFFELVEAANVAGSTYTTELEAVADMRQWMRMFAFRHVVGDWDGLGYHRAKNAFLYRPIGGRWKVIPWDLDFALGGDSHHWSHDLFDVENMPVIEQMIQHPPFKRYYWQTLHAAAHGPLLSTRINPVMDEVYAALIEQGVAAASPVVPKDWIANRRTYILQQLQDVTSPPLLITTQNGDDFTTTNSPVTLSGLAPIHMVTLLFNGVEQALTWTSVTNWTVSLYLTGGTNVITLTGHDAYGELLDSTSITITVEGDFIAPDLMTAIEGGVPVTLNLNQLFSEMGGSPDFDVVIARTNFASGSISGGILELSGIRRGETDVTVIADDGVNPQESQTFRFLIYPEAHTLSGGNFTFSYWNPDTPELTYPDKMLFLQSATNDTELDTPLEYAYHLEPEDYHVNDSGTIGFPYNNTGRTRINGLHAEGLAFINTGQNRDLGGALLALDTTGASTTRVAWIGGTVSPNVRIYALRLQYRVGKDGPFVDVLDETNEPIVYVRNATAGHFEPMGPVDLPAAALNETYVQLLWRYYRVEGESGARAQLRLDDVVVTSGASAGVEGFVFDVLPAAAQSGNALGSVVVRAVDGEGVTVSDYDGSVTITLDGSGSISGTLAVSAVNGMATFEDLSVTGAGSHRLIAEALDVDPQYSAYFNVVRVTEILMPLFMQGDQDVGNNNLDRVPFAYRIQLEGLLPDATYRYGNRVVLPGDSATQDGAGNTIYVTGAETNWIRSTDAPRFLDGDFALRHYEFTTDAGGNYNGWFVTEPSGNARFTPGNTVYARLLLNDGNDGEGSFHYLTTTSAVTVIRFGAATNEATAIMGPSAFPAKHFVYLYDHTTGSGRPLAGVQVEITGSEMDNRYAPYYEQIVALTPAFWGTLIPNALPNGVRRIETRSLADGSILGSDTYEDGITETINPSSGLTPIDLTVPSGFTVWQEDNYSPAELADPNISGPLADPENSGILNLLRYALGLGRYDTYATALPDGLIAIGNGMYRHRRLLESNSGITYVISVADDLLSGIWDIVVLGTDLLFIQAIPTGDGVTELVTYQVPGATLIDPKYFRLQVVLIE